MAEPGPHVLDTAAGQSLVRRRWKVVVVGILLGLLAGQLFTVLSTPRYSSTTAVLVLPTRTTTTGASGGAPSDVNMNTESELVRSAQVAQAAADALEGDVALEDVLERLTVAVPPNSQVLSISYADRTAELAQSGARAVAQAYLSSRQADVQADVERLTGALRKDLEFAEEQLRLATDKAASLPSNSPDRVYAEAQRDILGTQITNLTSRLTTIQASTDRAGVIITDAVLPTRASFPVPALNIAAGLVLGLLLGPALALLVDRVDRRLHRGPDVERLLGLPVLADLTEHGNTPDLAFDRLRNAVEGRTHEAGPVQVTDASDTGASAAVVLGLARSWARVNGATTLVLAHPASSLPDQLDLSGRPGLADLLRGEVDLEHVLHDHPAHPGLLVVPPGRDPEELTGLLQSPAASAALTLIGRSATAVVLETAGTSASAAAETLAATSAVVVLAVDRSSKDRAVTREVRSVRQMGGVVGGVVLVPRRRSRGDGTATAAAQAGHLADSTSGWHAGTPAAAPDDPAAGRTAGTAKGWAGASSGTHARRAAGAPTTPATGAVGGQRPPL